LVIFIWVDSSFPRFWVWGLGAGCGSNLGWLDGLVERIVWGYMGEEGLCSWYILLLLLLSTVNTLV
jgi:hypothetical protein